MCEKCEKLEAQLEEETKSPKITKTHWWVGIVVTILIFVFTQIFLYGKIVGKIETHIDEDMSTQELNKVFVQKDQLKLLEDMVKYLYQKEGGK